MEPGESVVVGIDEVGKGAGPRPLERLFFRLGRVKALETPRCLHRISERSFTTKLENGLKIGLLVMLLLKNAMSWVCPKRNDLLPPSTDLLTLKPDRVLLTGTDYVEVPSTTIIKGDHVHR